jgi:hypothetical protein
MDLSILANIGTLNSLNGSISKDSSNFVYYNKHNQWLCLLFFIDNMLYVGSNDAIEKEFEDSVRNRFDVKFLGPAK